MPTPEEKRALAMRAEWPVEIAADYFDLPVAEVRSLMAAPGEAVVDRFDLEKRLLTEELIGLDWLALEFGVPREPLEAAMRRPPAGWRLAPFQLDTYTADGRYALPRKIAEAWIKAVLPRHRTWSSLDARARDLAAQLGCAVRPCAVSKRFGEDPAATATCRCVVTWDDVSRAHQEYVDNRKPMSLEPDHVGWHAIVDGFRVSALWRGDLTNMVRYLEERGKTWRAA